MGKIQLTETVLRDAHQSLLATRMKTEDMVPIIEKLDKVGFFSLEAWGGATFDVCIRYLNEDPWDRLRLLSDAAKKTPIQMLLRGQNLLGYKHYADDIVDKFVENSYANGVEVFRIFDALNDIRNMERSIKAAKQQGAHVQATISYTRSPVHSNDKFVEFAKELEALECDSVSIKDMAGLINPTDTYDLVRKLKEETELMVDLHCHCTSGMTPMSYYAACQAGVDILDTAMSPFAWGTSQPPTESIVAGLEGSEWDTGLDLKILSEIKRYFEELKDKYSTLIDPISESIDTDVLLYQIPGGMLSNLVSQLKEQNALDKYQDVLDEMPRVRKDLGYPPLVTPTSQIVGIQAVNNIMGGAPYERVSNEVKEYIKGNYGKPPAPVDPEIAKKIIGDEEPITCRPADLIEPEYEKFKKEGEDLGIIHKEEDVLTYASQPTAAVKFLKGNCEVEPIPEPPSVGIPGEIPLKYKVQVDEDVYDVVVVPDGNPCPEGGSSPDEVPEGGLVCELQGMVVKVNVEVGAEVKKGDIVVVVEAMKMENDIKAEYDGTVSEVRVDSGDDVKPGSVLLVIKPD